MTEMTINGIDLSVYNARLLSFSVSGTTVTNSFSDASDFLKMPMLFSTVPSTRTLTIMLTFFPRRSGENSRNTSIPDRLSVAAENITRFEGLLVGKVVEISLPDGYIYTAVVQSLSPATFDGSGEHDVTYTFAAIRHKTTVEKHVSPNGFVFCESNTETQCMIKAKFNSFSNTKNKAKLFGTIIHNLSNGSEIVIDGINGIVTENGNNKFLDTNLIDFPVLQPGKNLVDCNETDVTISVVYTPIYI